MLTSRSCSLPFIIHYDPYYSLDSGIVGNPPAYTYGATVSKVYQSSLRPIVIVREYCPSNCAQLFWVFYSSSDLVSDSLPRHSYLESHLVRPVFCLNMSYNGREADRRHVSTFLGLYAMLPPRVATSPPQLTPHSFILDRLVQRCQRRQRSCVNSLILLSKSIRHLPPTHFTFFHMHCHSTHFSEKNTDGQPKLATLAIVLGSLYISVTAIETFGIVAAATVSLKFHTSLPLSDTCYLLPVHPSSSPRLLEPIPNSQSPLTR